MKTPESRLRASAKYEQKLKRRNVIFKQAEHAKLLKVIDEDQRPFSSLAIELLTKHYGLDKDS